MKKRNLLRLALLAFVALAGWLFLWWWSTPNLRLNRETFEQIHSGMTEQEIALVIGGPPTNQGTHQSMYLWRTIQNRFDITAVKGPGTMREWKAWIGNGVGIYVGFDETGHAMEYYHFHFDETLLEKLRRILRLS